MTKPQALGQVQLDAAKLEVLRAYFDFRDGRPTAETVAEKLNIPVGTVRRWLSDPQNMKFIDEIVPLWPNVGGARQYAGDLVPEALGVLAATMRGELPDVRAKDRYDAARFILALAGVRPTDGPVEEKSDEKESKPPVLLNLFVGGSPEKIQVIEGEVREVEPARIVAAATR